MAGWKLPPRDTMNEESRQPTGAPFQREDWRASQITRQRGGGVSDRSVELGGQLKKKKKGASSTLLQTCSCMEWEGNADILSRWWSRKPWQDDLETLPTEQVTNPIWGSKETVVPPKERRSLSYRAMARFTGIIFKGNPLFKTELQWWSDNK